MFTYLCVHVRIGPSAREGKGRNDARTDILHPQRGIEGRGKGKGGCPFGVAYILGHPRKRRKTRRVISWGPEVGGAAREEIRQVPWVASKVEGKGGAFHPELFRQYENSSITCFLTGEKKVAAGCLLRLEDPPHSSPSSRPSPLFSSPKGGGGGDVNSQGRRE